jgi:hypothetical protein
MSIMLRNRAGSGARPLRNETIPAIPHIVFPIYRLTGDFNRTARNRVWKIQLR